MKKIKVLLRNPLASFSPLGLPIIAYNSQNIIDEQRNVKQPPMLLGRFNLVNKLYYPLLNMS